MFVSRTTGALADLGFGRPDPEDRSGRSSMIRGAYHSSFHSRGLAQILLCQPLACVHYHPRLPIRRPKPAPVRPTALPLAPS